ncbi:hypothetical protein C8A01DRAFT_14659, partial [Parachaetomium inaequale]
SAEIGPRLPFGQETSLSTWPEIGFEHADMPSDLSGGRQAHCLAVHGTGDITVDPQYLTFGPDALGLDFSGQVLGVGLPPLFPEGVPDSCYHGETGFYGTELGYPVNVSATYPAQSPCYPTGDSIPGAPVFSVAFPPVSHASDE